MTLKNVWGETRGSDSDTRVSGRSKSCLILGLLALLMPPTLSLLAWKVSVDYSKTVSDSWGLEFAIAGLFILATLIIGVILGIIAFFLGNREAKCGINNNSRRWAKIGQFMGLIAVSGYLGFIGLDLFSHRSEYHQTQNYDSKHRQTQSSYTKPAPLQPGEISATVNESIALCTEMRNNGKAQLLGGDESAIEYYRSRCANDYLPRLKKLGTKWQDLQTASTDRTTSDYIDSCSIDFSRVTRRCNSVRFNAVDLQNASDPQAVNKELISYLDDAINNLQQFLGILNNSSK